MKYKINAYFAVLLVTIIGAGASLILIHVANANAFSVTFTRGGVDYSQFK